MSVCICKVVICVWGPEQLHRRKFELLYEWIVLFMKHSDALEKDGILVHCWMHQGTRVHFISFKPSRLSCL